MTNVVEFYPGNAAKNPDNVLKQAVGEYDSLTIIGYDKNGDMDVRASTNLNQGQLLWAIERFKHNLLAGDYSKTGEGGA